MNGENTDDNDIPEDDLAEDETASVELSETEILTSLNADDIGDLTVELNVEELVANVESLDVEASAREREVRRKVDELRAEKDEELDGTYNFNLDEDL